MNAHCVPERRVFERSCMCALRDGRNGPVGAHPRKDGSTTRTLAGSVRYCETHYTRIDEFAYLPHEPLPLKRILDASLRFPELCGQTGLQPSPKQVLEGS